MAGYIGTTPVPQATQHRESFTATGGQTSFATAGYTPQFIDVYLNGVKLAPADFTATNGSDVVLASGATASDILEIVAYTPFEVANQTFTGTTTAANFTVTGAFTSQGIDDNANAVAITIDSSENVGIGTSSPSKQFHQIRTGSVSDLPTLAVETGFITQSTNVAASSQNISIIAGVSGESRLFFGDTGDEDVGNIIYNHASNYMLFSTAASESMRIDSSGNLLVGMTSANTNNDGAGIRADGLIHGKRADVVATFNRKTSDGTVVQIAKDNTVVGSIGSASGATTYIDGGSQFAGLQFGGDGSSEGRITPRRNGASADAATDLGTSSLRFKDLYLSSEVKLPNCTLADQVIKSNTFIFKNGAGTTEYARFDSSGNLLVGTTDTNGGISSSDTDGSAITLSGSTGQVYFTSAQATANAGSVGYFNRKTTDGDIVQFRKDGATVGSIGVESGEMYLGTGAVGLLFDNTTAIKPYHTTNNANRDALTNLGSSGARFKDLYLSGGVYLGGTGSANKLDDYEEGTWNLGTNSDPTGVIAANSYGLYRRIGDTVLVQCVFQVSTNFTNAAISGLPFNPKNGNTIVSSVHGLGVVRASNAVVFAQVTNGSNVINFVDSSGASYSPTTVRDPFRFVIMYRAV